MSSAVAPAAIRAVEVARIPRDIGTSTGVNEIADARRRPAAVRFCTISGVCRWMPPTAYADADPAISLGEQVGAQATSRRPRFRPRGRTTRSSASITPAAMPGARPERDGGDVAAGDRDPGRADQLIALLLRPAGEQQLGQPVGPGAGVLAAVERAQAAGSVSRWSAPQSMTSTSSGSAAVIAPDAPCGRARNTTSAPESVSAWSRPAPGARSETRCGCTGGERLPGLRVRGDDGHLELGMCGEKPEEFTPGIAARACDGDGKGHDSTLWFGGTGPERRRRARRLNGSAARRRPESARTADHTERSAPGLDPRIVHGTTLANPVPSAKPLSFFRSWC